MTMIFDPFAELSRANKTKANNGIEYTDLAMTAANVFYKIIGATIPQAAEQEWFAVAEKAVQIIDLPEDEKATLEISAKKLAKALYNQKECSADRVPDWDSLLESDRVAWEAVGRHLANLIDSDGSPEFAELEERIVAWAKNRSSQLICS